MSTERACLVGTAPSYVQTPWHDAGLMIAGLNDGWRMKGFERADRWYDIHPPDKWWVPPKGPIMAHQVPLGHYSRPPRYVDWIAGQRIPVYLHPRHRELMPASAGWPSARPFPKGEVEAHFGRYFTSTPAWIIGHMVLEGVKELWVTGIHLATEHEYVEQRPQFEFILGRFLGKGRVMETRADGFRHYETADSHLVLPDSTPVLSSSFQYGFDPRPLQVLDHYRWDLHRIGIKRQRCLWALSTSLAARWRRRSDMHQTPWWSRRKLREELSRLDAWEADVQDMMARAKRHAEAA